MSAKDTSGAPHDERLAPRIPGAVPGGPLPAQPMIDRKSVAGPRHCCLQFLIAILKKQR